MTGKKSICFIINPKSGTGNKRHFPRLIHNNLDSSHYRYDIRYTRFAGHGIELGVQAVKDNFDVIVAAGGDGTVNEVARSMIHSHAVLGLIPSGSGNGFARHLKIPANPVRAIRMLNHFKIKHTDTGILNNMPFINAAGTGFDAHVAHLFQKPGKRGFSGYTRLVLREFYKYKSLDYIINTGKKTIVKKAFLITFSNGSQFGSGTKIAPKAKLDDGLINLCMVKKFPVAAAPGLITRLFFNTITGSRYYNSVLSGEIKIRYPENTCGNQFLVHLDGEPLWIHARELHVKVIPASLKVASPS